MIELIRQWVLGVTCAALLGAFAVQLSGKGALGQVGRLVSGLVLLWSVLSPLPGVDIARLTQPFLDAGIQTEQEHRRLSEQTGLAMRAVIEQDSQAYILDKAQQLGLENCRVQVTCRLEEGVWLPWSVQVAGISPSAPLTQVIQDDLGVVGDRIFYEGGE